MGSEYQAGKEVIVPFSTAVARANNCSSITYAQRARRATAGSGPIKRTQKRKAAENAGEVDLGLRKL
jgi:hypothetical protein